MMTVVMILFYFIVVTSEPQNTNQVQILEIHINKFEISRYVIPHLCKSRDKHYTLLVLQHAFLCSFESATLKVNPFFSHLKVELLIKF